MRILPGLISCCLLAATAASQPLRTLEPDLRKRLAERLEVADPFEVLVRLSSDDADVREAAESAFARLEKDDSAAAIRLALAGLWSDRDDVALGGCSRLHWWHLDLEDSRRFIEVGLGNVFEKEPIVDYDTFRRVLDSDSVAKLFAQDPPRTRDVYYVIGQTHRVLRAEHLPLICRMTRSDQSMLRSDAMDYVKVMAWYTDRFRDEIAHAVLAWNGAEIVDFQEEKPGQYREREYELPEKHDGYPTELCAVLRRLFLDESDKKLEGLRPWARRWVLDSRAGVSDARLIAELSRRDDDMARQVGLRAAWDARGPAATEALMAAARDEETTEEHRRIALAGLALHGDQRAADDLRREAEDDSEALVAWIAAGGADEVIATATGPDATRALALLELLDDAVSDSLLSVFRIPTDLGRRMEAAAFAAKLDAARISLLLETFPRCRTERLVRHYLEVATREHMPVFRAEFCEVLDADATRAKLREFRDDEDPTIRDAVRRYLALLGDPESADAILEWYTKHTEFEPLLLARTKAPEIRAWLLETAKKVTLPADTEKMQEGRFAPLLALACVDGLPQQTAAGWLGSLNVLPLETVRPSFAEWRDLVISGEPLAALRAYLRVNPWHYSRFTGLGQVRDPAVLTYLRGQALRRESGSYHTVLSELAAAGDPDAVDELRAICRAGYYSWVDNLPGRAMTEGWDPESIAFWHSELESNCCRNVAAATVFDSMLGVEVHRIGDTANVTRSRGLADWPALARHARWSQIAGHAVVLIRE